MWSTFLFEIKFHIRIEHENLHRFGIVSLSLKIVVWKRKPLQKTQCRAISINLGRILRLQAEHSLRSHWITRSRIEHDVLRMGSYFSEFSNIKWGHEGTKSYFSPKISNKVNFGLYFNVTFLSVLMSIFWISTANLVVLDVIRNWILKKISAIALGDYRGQKLRCHILINNLARMIARAELVLAI